MQLGLLGPEFDVANTVIAKRTQRKPYITRGCAEVQYLLNLLVVEPEEPMSAPVEAALIKVLGSEQDEVVQFSDEEIVGLHDWVMQRSLHTLMDRRCGEDVRIEVWQWIQADDEADPDKVLPFSFQACCAATGVDTEEMRTRLAFLTRDEKFRTKVNDPGFNQSQAEKLFRKRHH